MTSTEVAAFAGHLKAFAASLTETFSSAVRGQPEDQLKSPLGELLRNGGEELGYPGVSIKTESTVEGVGRPDLGVATGGLLCGYVELKAPGKGATPTRYTGRDREQWLKFRSLPNLIYTDGTEFSLYREGERKGAVRLSGDPTADGEGAVADEDAQKLGRLFRDFLSWEPIVPGGPKDLAGVLAPLCHLLRDDVLSALADEDSNLSNLAEDWRAFLFPDADDAQFADAYAQTLTYALLLARFSSGRSSAEDGADKFDTSRAADVLAAEHALLSRTLELLADEHAREEISLGVDLLERSIAAVSPEEVAESDDDPWLYFYEDFLAAYDRNLRKDRGVYYTPAEVVRAQVRLVSQLLRQEFGKGLSYADDGVVVLDPAAGTGTYPLAVVQHGLDAARDYYGEAASSATEMAKNVHAFELLVGPYTVAHLRLSKELREAGGSLPDDGLHLYLADTLESPHAEPPGRLPLFARELGRERERAQRVKREVPILVCLGNPPYDRQHISPEEEGVERKGGWVRYGEGGEDERPIFEDFREPARQAGAGGHLKNLYNDYVYFWRWALWKVFESKGGPGIVSFITASSYLRGPGFVGMREVMRATFDELWVIDLEGGSLGARKTENIFAIRTPVAIAVGVRYGEPNAEEPARVRYAKIEGSRDQKLARLGAVEGFGDLSWEDCFSGWQDVFLPQRESAYFSWPLLTDVFPWQHSGVQMKRTWPIGETAELLEERWRALLEAPDRRAAFREADRKVEGNYYPLEEPRVRLDSIKSLDLGTDPPPIVRYAYRSFDRQWVLKDARLGDRMRPELWRAHSERQVYMTSLLTEVLGEGPAATVAAEVPDLHHFRGSFGGRHVIPLWRDSEVSRPNITHGILDLLSQAYGENVGAEDLFAYAYAVLASPSYTERFWDELTIPGPRLPLTKDAALFRSGAELGRELIRLHTYGQRFGEGWASGRMNPGRAKIETPIPGTPEEYPEDFDYDEESRRLRVGAGEIAPVDPRIYNYSVSGYEVVKSFLAHRMKAPSGRSSSPLDQIRPQRWSRQMTDELLKLIWILEATVDKEPELAAFLEEVVGSELFTTDELPQPADEEHQSPKEPGEGEAAYQMRFQDG